MRSASRLVPLPALAAGLLCAASAMAQTFSGFGPAGPLVLPKGPDAARPAAAEPAAPAETVRDPVLRRLPSVATPLRLWGENGDIVWAFYATEAEARTGGRFQIGYRAAVSVLPEVSRLTLRINGTVIGEDPIDGARGLRTVSFDVPPGALSRGFNAVRVTTSQRHRVDCSVAATYELWTQIDPDATGFASAASGLGEPGDIAGARVSADGAVPIRLIQAGERLSEREVERLLGALQDTVLAGRFAQPSADFGPAVPGGDGLALAVGPADQLARALDLAPLGPVSGPRLALLPRAAGRRPVLVATGASESDVARSLAELRDLHAGPPPGTPLGLLALADAGGRRIEGGEVVALGDVGMADAHVTAGMHRIGVDLALPHDVLVADYDRLTLELDGSYAAGLAEGAQIAVAINGVSAGSTPLARPGGESFRRRAMFLPLRLLRPGLNRVTITAELPREEDKDCRVEASAPRERLTLLATTRLRIPALARIARQPDLAGTLGAGFPYAQGQRRTMLSVPAPDRDSMAAAATLAARLGLAAGRAIPFGFAAGRAAGGGPTLVVSAAPLLDADTVRIAGLDPQALRDAWTGREALAAAPTSPASWRNLLRRDAVAACHARPAQGGAPAGAEGDLGGASAVLAQTVTGPASDDILTLVTGPSAAALREAVDCLVHPRIWSAPQGRRALLSASDGTVASVPEDAPRYVATAPPSPMNLRRIAAGWLSLHAGLYGLFALLVAGGLAGSTQLLVRNLGRRSQ